MNKLLLARAYIKNGWSVFPIPKLSKKPTIEWGKYQIQYATDEELIQWFEKNDNEIGIATGKLSNLSVLDADGVIGVQDLIRLGLSSPATVLTGGGGKHLYYQWSGERNVQKSKDHQGLDRRGEGGYVIAPGSGHISGMNYRWANGVTPSAKTLSSWPKGLLDTPSIVGTQVVVSPTEPWLLDAIKGASSGDRHRLLVKLICYLLPRHNYAYVKQNLLDWNLKNTPPLANEEVVKQLDDIHKRFQTGQYKTSFVPKREIQYENYAGTFSQTSTSNGGIQSSPKKDLDIQTSKGVQAYFDEQLKGPTVNLPELPTGFASIDQTTWGAKRGNITVIGARPGVGKTTYVVNVTSHLLKLGKRVLFFSTEMSHKELFDKFAASEGEIPASNITTRNFTQDDRDKLSLFLPKFGAYDFHTVNLFRPTQQDVKEAVERIKPDVLIFDHIQHIAEGNSEYETISKFTRFLKELAMQANIAVVVNSQLSRASTFDDRMPALQDLKGCGTIEEEASVVILMHDAQHKGDRAILFRIAKNRFGKCGDTTLMFREETTKFEDMQIGVA